MEIVIDRDKCMGAGQCVLAAPEVFDQHEQDGRALLLVERPDRSRLDAVLEARDTCPLSAIRLLADVTDVTDVADMADVTDRRTPPTARHDRGIPGE
ncbi:ferredoxin [Streptomyces sporangiiformans]|uniref:Ferredoxin n=2 Tax=Streptomyces sporangiiformans TaxID=2315329 RepID=A0A505DQK6_9ACTN|nr:ferredoxin [Streptomyces sporangiiformans]